MSPRERELQHEERITGIDDKLNTLLKLFKLWPIFTAFVGVVVGIITTTIWIKNWDDNIVKQPQLARTEARFVKIDSALNVKTELNIVKNNEQDQRLGKLESTPKLRLTRVTQSRDKYGNVHDNPLN